MSRHQEQPVETGRLKAEVVTSRGDQLKVSKPRVDVTTSGDTRSRMQYQELMSRQDKLCRDIMTTSGRLQKI